MNNNEWVRTDDLQFTKKITSTKFQIIDIGKFPGGSYAVNFEEIDIEDYSEKEIEQYVNGYYDSLKGLRNIYKENSNQIIAECIAEQQGLDEDTKEFKDIKSVQEWLLREYGIELD